MHHGTCVTHVPCCMSGSLTRGGGENVPGIPGACATRNFTYLARSPWKLTQILQMSLRIRITGPLPNGATLFTQAPVIVCASAPRDLLYQKRLTSEVLSFIWRQHRIMGCISPFIPQRQWRFNQTVSILEDEGVIIPHTKLCSVITSPFHNPR